MKTLLAQNHYQGQTIRTKEISNGRLGQCRYGANHKKGKTARKLPIDRDTTTTPVLRYYSNGDTLFVKFLAFYFKTDIIFFLKIVMWCIVLSLYIFSRLQTFYYCMN